MMPGRQTPVGASSAATRSRILVVEDEILIRQIVSDELRDAGFDVIEAFNADEALTVLQSRVRVDLIISDVRMPGSLDGMGLLAFVRAAFPTLPMIVTSGHLEPSIATGNGANRFLAKPFAIDLIVSAVQEELTRTL